MVRHLPHPTDHRRTVGGYERTACGRWARVHGFWRLPLGEPCAHCRQLLLTPLLDQPPLPPPSAASPR